MTELAMHCSPLDEWLLALNPTEVWGLIHKHSRTIFPSIILKLFCLQFF